MVGQLRNAAESTTIDFGRLSALEGALSLAHRLHGPYSRTRERPSRVEVTATAAATAAGLASTQAPGAHFSYRR